MTITTAKPRYTAGAGIGSAAIRSVTRFSQLGGYGRVIDRRAAAACGPRDRGDLVEWSRLGHRRGVYVPVAGMGTTLSIDDFERIS